MTQPVEGKKVYIWNKDLPTQAWKMKSEHLSNQGLQSTCTTCILCPVHYRNPLRVYTVQLSSATLAGLISQPPTQMLCWPWNALVWFPSHSQQSWAAASPPRSLGGCTRAGTFIYLFKKIINYKRQCAVPGGLRGTCLRQSGNKDTLFMLRCIDVCRIVKAKNIPINKQKTTVQVGNN